MKKSIHELMEREMQLKPFKVKDTYPVTGSFHRQLSLSGNCGSSGDHVSNGPITGSMATLLRHFRRMLRF